MPNTVGTIIEQIKRFSTEDRNQLYLKLLGDPDIRSDIFDLMLVLDAEKDEQGTVSLDEYVAGKRTYDVQ
jgi:hypothetical protein